MASYPAHSSSRAQLLSEQEEGRTRSSLGQVVRELTGEGLAAALGRGWWLGDDGRLFGSRETGLERLQESVVYSTALQRARPYYLLMVDPLATINHFPSWRLNTER